MLQYNLSPLPPFQLKNVFAVEVFIVPVLEQLNSSALLSFDPHSWSQYLSYFRFTFLA